MIEVDEPEGEETGKIVDAEEENEGKKERGPEEAVATLGSIRERVLAIVKELRGVMPHVVAERIGVPLPRVSEAAKSLKSDGSIKVARNLPFISSHKKSNATYYLGASRSTALHDTVMNEVWKRNIELGGQCKDYSFQYG